MEIIIGMIIAFILGAFVRKPFLLPKKETVPEESTVEESEERKRQDYLKQLNEMYSYTGEKNRWK